MVIYGYEVPGGTYRKKYIRMKIRGRRRKQLLDGIKETKEYCKLKEEALDRTV
jgi:hypothetical protein